MGFRQRAKNPFFWISLGSVVLTAMGMKPEMFTSWDIVIEQIKNLFSNPFLLGTTIFSVIGVIMDPTSRGIRDNK